MLVPVSVPAHPTAAERAVDATRVVAKLDQHPGDIEMPPAPAAIPVVAGTLPPALGAARASPRRCDVDHESDFVKADIKNTCLFQTQEVAE